MFSSNLKTLKIKRWYKSSIKNILKKLIKKYKKRLLWINCYKPKYLLRKIL